MSEFNVGDKVVRTKKSGWPCKYGEVGVGYEVLGVSESGAVVVVEGQRGADPSSFVLVSRATPQPDYNDGNWHRWHGGECPVHPETKGKFVFADGSICMYKPAGEWCWSDSELPIIAFRVTKPYVEPREYWIDTVDMTATTKPCHANSYYVHVREVTQ